MTNYAVIHLTSSPSASEQARQAKAKRQAVLRAVWRRRAQARRNLLLSVRKPKGITNEE